jgi:hypothetical protein
MGRIDEQRLRAIFASYLGKPDPPKWVWIGIDASSIARPEAVTSADRTAQHVHNLPECKKPITFGWQFSTVVVLRGVAEQLDVHPGSATRDFGDDSHPGC